MFRISGYSKKSLRFIIKPFPAKLCFVHEFVAEMESKSKLILLILIGSTISIKHPNVSKNPEHCYKTFMKDTVHNCNCEPYKDGFLDNKHSYLWQKVSTFYLSVQLQC